MMTEFSENYECFVMTGWVLYEDSGCFVVTEWVFCVDNTVSALLLQSNFTVMTERVLFDDIVITMWWSSECFMMTTDWLVLYDRLSTVW